MTCHRHFAGAVALIAVAWLAAPAAAADADLLLWLKLDETSGTLAADASGNGHTATVITGTGTPEWVTGRKGNALVIAGLTATRARRVQVPWSSSLAVTDQLTAMAWIRLDGTAEEEEHGGGSQTIAGRSASTDWCLLVRHSQRRVAFTVDTGANRITVEGSAPGSGLAVGTWYHVAATYDGSRLRIYLNGTQLASTACTGNLQISSNAGIPLGVGAFPASTSAWQDDFPGALDEVKIWKRALTASEIAAEMNAGASLSRLRWRENF